jgi:hypothetical protein
MTGDDQPGGALERDPYAAYLDAKTLPTVEDPQTGEHRYSAEAVFGMQRAILAALKSEAALPVEIRAHLAIAFEELCAGIASDLLTPLKHAGGRERPIAKHLQADAVRYLRWVEDGRIDDPAPTKTVAAAYGVDARTARNWQRVWHNQPTPPLFEEYGPDMVTALMRISGRAYRRFLPKPQARR